MGNGIGLLSGDYVSGNLHLRDASGNTQLRVGGADGNAEAITTTPQTLTEADNGKTFFVGVADCVFTLPSTFAGCRFTFIVKTLSTTTGCSLSPAAADAIHGGGLTSVDDKDLVNTAATDAEGDSVTIVGDGVDGWFIEAINGTWAKET